MGEARGRRRKERSGRARRGGGGGGGVGGGGRSGVGRGGGSGVGVAGGQGEAGGGGLVKNQSWKFPSHIYSISTQSELNQKHVELQFCLFAFMQQIIAA